jgi:hypothetical protein
MLAGGPVSRKGFPNYFIPLRYMYRTKRKRHTRSNQSQTRFMAIKGLVNGHNREPETWHEYIDEEEGGKGAQCHEGQHDSSARVRGPADMGRRREGGVLLIVPFPWGAC